MSVAEVFLLLQFGHVHEVGGQRCGEGLVVLAHDLAFPYLYHAVLNLEPKYDIRFVDEVLAGVVVHFKEYSPVVGPKVFGPLHVEILLQDGILKESFDHLGIGVVERVKTLFYCHNVR